MSVERVGELGHRKIPGLLLTGFTIQQKNRWRVHRETQIYSEWQTGRAKKERSQKHNKEGGKDVTGRKGR